MKTVDEVIANWTSEEREQHKDLIEECKNRQANLLKNREVMRKTLENTYLDRVGEVAGEAYFIVEGTNARIGCA